MWPLPPIQKEIVPIILTTDYIELGHIIKRNNKFILNKYQYDNIFIDFFSFFNIEYIKNKLLLFLNNNKLKNSFISIAISNFFYIKNQSNNFAIDDKILFQLKLLAIKSKINLIRISPQEIAIKKSKKFHIEHKRTGISKYSLSTMLGLFLLDHE